MFDTKGGFTANESEVKDKADALTNKMAIFNLDGQRRLQYTGGIVIYQEGLWLYNDGLQYTAYAADKSRWKNFTDLFG